MNAVLGRKKEAMRFVINGRTFDTATATIVAINGGIRRPNDDHRVSESEIRYEHVLYRTAKGAFFLHEHQESVKGGRPVLSDFAKEMTAKDAVEWITEHRALVLDADGLALPPEA